MFTNVTGRRLWPQGNKELTCKEEESMRQDDFSHEQYLVIHDSGKNVLISGCAHNGILNILDAYKERFGGCPDAVVSGFHMMKKQGYNDEDLETIDQIAKELKKLPCQFFTGHCTGEIPFERMRKVMEIRLNISVRAGNPMAELQIKTFIEGQCREMNEVLRWTGKLSLSNLLSA